MWKYATRRVLTMIPILIGVSMVVFLLVASLPGDAVDAHAGGNITAEKIAQNKALLGLDKPIPERYVNWEVMRSEEILVSRSVTRFR